MPGLVAYDPECLLGPQLVSALIEAAGLALIYLAAGRVSAVARAVLTGFGHSLVYSSGKRGRSTLHRL